MLLTHIGHSCLIVEGGGARVMLDPGVFTPGFETTTGLDAVIVTHQHVDHVDLARLPSLVAANPDATVLAEPSTVELMRGAGVTAEPLAPGDERTFGGLRVRAVGGMHAKLFDEDPPLGNVGLMVRGDGEPTLFHPGDSYYLTPSQIDVLALPLSAPWTGARGTVEFLRAVHPPVAVPIHDGLLIPQGRDLYLRLVRERGPSDTEVRDLAGAGPTRV